MIATNTAASVSALRCQHIAAAVARDGDGIALRHIDARAIAGGHAVLAQQVDGGIAALDVDGIAARHRDMGITQIDIRVAACHADAIAARSVEIIVSVGGNRISLCPL